MRLTVERKRGVLNGRNGQNGNFLLCRPEALYTACARPVTDKDEIEFGYDNDETKAASCHLDLIVEVVQLTNCVEFPACVHPDTLIVINGALRLHCLLRHYQRRGGDFKVQCHMTEVIDCQGKSFALTCFDLRAMVLSKVLKQQTKDAQRKVVLYHCLDFIKSYFETVLKPHCSCSNNGRGKTGRLKPIPILESMYLKLLEGAGYQDKLIPTPHTLRRMMRFVMAISPLALKNLTGAPVSDKRFNFIFDAAWSSAALSEPQANLALKWISVGMQMHGDKFMILFSAIAAKVPRPDQLSFIDAYKADLAAWIAPPEAVIAPAAGCAVDGSGGSEEEEEDIECEVRSFALSLF